MPAEGSVRLLLDVGGQGCRGIAMDERGQILAQARARIDTRIDGVRVELDGMQIAAATQRVADEVSAQVQRTGRAIQEAGLAVQRGSVVCWHQGTGKPLSPVLSWRDRRGGIDSGSDPARAEAVKQSTGLRFSPYGGGSKLAWCQANIAAVAEAARTGELACGPLGSFLVSQLDRTRPCVVDDTLAQRTLLWSRHTLDWDPWLLELHGIAENSLPSVVPPGSELARLDAVRGRPALKLLTGDQNVVPFVTGAPRSDTLYINLGTGAFLLRPLAEAIETPLFQLSLLDRLAHGEGKYALEASVHGAASALGWLESHAGICARSVGAGPLREQVDKPPLFLNSVDGLGSPWWSPGPEPGFVKETGGREPQPEAQLLAVLESIAFLVRANFDAMNQLLDRPETIILCGGLSQNTTLTSLLADILESDLLQLSPPEGTATGLCMRLCPNRQGHPQTQRVSYAKDGALQARYRQWLEHMSRTVAVHRTDSA